MLNAIYVLHVSIVLENVKNIKVDIFHNALSCNFLIYYSIISILQMSLHTKLA